MIGELCHNAVIANELNSSHYYVDVQLKAQELIALQNMKKNEHRLPTQFEARQLILCPAHPLDTVNYKTSLYKAVPRWTLPYRVLAVSSSGKAATVRCLLTQKTRHVHIQDARFISPPRGDIQK